VAHGAVEAVVAGPGGEIWSALAIDASIVRPEVAGPLLIAASAYAVGWRCLRRRGGSVPGSRVTAYAGGLLALFVALSAPLDRAAHASFAAHMAQHLLLIVMAAPLLLLADPFPVLLWALPRRLRTATGRRLRPRTPLRRLGCGLTLMTVAWLAHVLTIWLWHLPGPYDAAVADRLVHDLEHLAFFGTAVLFWWPIVQPAPRWRARSTDGARVGYLVLAALQGGLLGLLLTLSPEVWYRSYANTADQSLGGLVMWGVGGAVDMLAVLVLMARYLASQDRAAPTH
jgi:putative membrane protein